MKLLFHPLLKAYEEDAYDYSAIDVLKLHLGKWGYQGVGVWVIWTSLACFHIMNDGIDPASGKRFAPVWVILEYEVIWWA